MKLQDVSDNADVHTDFSVIDDDDNDDVWCKNESHFRNQGIFLWTLF